MRSSRLKFLVVCVAAVGAAVAIASCDFFLQGTYTGLCDEPSTLFGDLGDPMKVRMAQCQVMNNVCCHARPPVGDITSATDLRTYCLEQWQCYLATDQGRCYNDIDCPDGEQCVNANEPARIAGTCQCPGNGVFCPSTSSESPSYCCPTGATCGMSSDCMAPTPPDDGGAMSATDGPGA